MANIEAPKDLLGINSYRNAIANLMKILSIDASNFFVIVPRQAWEPYAIEAGAGSNAFEQIRGRLLAAYFEVGNSLRLLPGSNSPDLEDSNGRMPFACAAENGYEAVVELLPENGADLESKVSYGSNAA
ncbi:hypothetical protein DL765_002572 [Monosporascus sp. GIB2]|nr:hypothetical protein DL765_002572 [Monosporascus sp. GIB2]